VEFEVSVIQSKTGRRSLNHAVRVIKIGGAPQKKKTDLKKISKTDNKVTMKEKGKKGAQKMKGGTGKGKLQKMRLTYCVPHNNSLA